MRRRLVILTEIIAPYRIPVFNALARREEVDLHVIFFSETDSTQRDWLVYKDEIQFSYQVLPSWRRRLGRHHILLNRGLVAALRKCSPDFMICGGYNYLASWQALWWARRKRVPFAIWVESTTQDFRKHRTLVESLKMLFLNHCDAFVVAGKSAAGYVKSLGASDERIYVAPDAVDTELFARKAYVARENAAPLRQALGLPSRFFLFVGRLVPEKGIFDLLTAYQGLPAELRTAVGLVFVGNGVASEELKVRSKAVSPGTVQLVGFAQREQLADYYALSEAFVFPTHSDPWGLVVNEAMACSLPIICSDAAGCAKDLVTDHWNGRITPPRNVVAIAAAMEELACDQRLRLEFAQHSWERIQHYSPEMCANGLALAALRCGAHRHA